MTLALKTMRGSPTLVLSRGRSVLGGKRIADVCDMTVCNDDLASHVVHKSLYLSMED